MDWKLLSTQKIREIYYSIFFRQCYLCQSPSKQIFCHHCQQGLNPNIICCQQCKRPCNQPQAACGQCQSNRPSYQVCVAPYLFSGTMRTLIHQIKFNHGGHFIRPLTERMCQNLVTEYQSRLWPQQLLFVPSHPKRIRQRGFCQTQLMAKQLHKQLQAILGKETPDLPKINPILKIQHSQAQHTLPRKARLTAPNKSYQIQGQVAEHVALFDDVMTTGSTIDACCQQLLKAGAKRIDVWVIARTPDKTH